MPARPSPLALVLALALTLLPGCAETDAGITTKVKAKFAADDVVKAHEIQVDTEQGVVTLTGNIDDPAAKEQALSLARRTEGVVEVRDMISVRNEMGRGDAPDLDRTPGGATDDAGITLSVKSRLLSDDLVKGLGIDVDTRGGVVYLTGSVATEAEKERAVQLARETEGVTDVQANLTVEGGR
jgi:hyperosmotically inducible protein